MQCFLPLAERERSLGVYLSTGREDDMLEGMASYIRMDRESFGEILFPYPDCPGGSVRY